MRIIEMPVLLSTAFHGVNVDMRGFDAQRPASDKYWTANHSLPGPVRRKPCLCEGAKIAWNDDADRKQEKEADADQRYVQHYLWRVSSGCH